jgi:hypothetical protein
MRVYQNPPLPKDIWSLILVKYLDIHSLYDMYCTSQSMREYYKENQIWRKRVPMDRLEYWDQCGLTDPYRLLLAISAIGKDLLQLPFDNEMRAHIEICGSIVMEDISVYGDYPKDAIESLGWETTAYHTCIHIQFEDIVTVIYHLLTIGYTKIYLKSV